jgi:hypothetical protein
MNYEEFSIIELEKQLERIKPIRKKIEYISGEILRCKKAIQDIKTKVKKVEPTEIRISAKASNPTTSLIELVNSNKKIKQIVTKKIIRVCTKKICNHYNSYLERSKFHLEHLKTKHEILGNGTDSYKDENKSTEESFPNTRIIWRKGKEKLIALFIVLYQNEILPFYSEEEILAHFSDDKQIPFNTTIKYVEYFCWQDSDCRFAVLVDELAKCGAIDDEHKYKTFSSHFVNRKNKVFKGLAQKRSYTDNYTKSGNLIREILNSEGFGL